MMLGLLGAKAMAPVAIVGCASVLDDQVRPESRVSQRPPTLTPASQWFVSTGSTARAAIRPAKLSFRAGNCTRGLGPMAFHICAWLCSVNANDRINPTNILR